MVVVQRAFGSGELVIRAVCAEPDLTLEVVHRRGQSLGVAQHLGAHLGQSFEEDRAFQGVAEAFGEDCQDVPVEVGEFAAVEVAVGVQEADHPGAGHDRHRDVVPALGDLGHRPVHA